MNREVRNTAFKELQMVAKAIPYVSIWAIIILACTACSNPPATPAIATGPKAEEPPACRLVVFVTIDTLRADHLPMYGYFRDTSPFLAERAAEGVVFDRAFAPMGATAPSHATMFTSLYPCEHGLSRNGLKLPHQFDTLAEILKTKHFHTAAFTSTVHFSRCNVAQGFDVLDELDDQEKLYRPAGETIDAAIQWLTTQPKLNDLFMWVHVFDPHFPYKAPDEYVQALAADGKDDDVVVSKFVVEQQKSDWGFWRYGTEYLARTIRGYDSEILYADAQLRRLFDYVNTRMPANETVWIFTSDHGEGLGNHKFGAHGDRIYQEQLHVPLIYYGPGRFKPTRISQVVDHTDLMPTILDLFGVPLPGSLTIEGHSMVPALLTGAALPRQYAIGQRQTYPENGAEENPFYEKGDRFSIQDHSAKYLWWTEGFNEFYDLQEDPHELHSLLNLGGERETKLRQLLVDKVHDMMRRAPVQAESVDEETKEALRALGYIE